MFSREKIIKEIYIDGMSCKHCSAKVENALKAIKGVTDVKVDLEEKKAVLKLKKEIENDLLKSTVENLGYTVTKI